MRPSFSATLLAVLLAMTARAEDLRLRLSVSGARVVLDGAEMLASSPAQATLEAGPGAHVLDVTKDGFEPFHATIAVSKKNGAELEVLLKVSAPPPAPASPPAAAEPVVAAPKPAERKGPPALRIAVYEFQAGGGADPRVAAILTEAMLAELRKLERVSPVGMGEIREMLSFEQQRQLLGCDDSSCIAEIGGALGVDELVTSALQVLGETQIVAVRRLDMKISQVKGSVTKRLARDAGEGVLAVVGPMVEELYADYPLRAGRQRGASEEAIARLNPPPLPRWAVYATAGGAGAGAVTGIVFGLLASQGESAFKAAVAEGMSDAGTPGAGLIKLRNEAKGNADRANLAWGTAGALAVVAGLEALFADWKGYRDASVTPGAPTVAIVASPDGIAVAGRF